MFHLDDIEESEDAEYIDVQAEPQQQAQSQPQPQPYLAPQPLPELMINDTQAVQLARYQRRGRAISMFVEIPVLTLVAFNDDVPGLVRTGAGLLAVWKAIELARGGGQMMQETAQDWVEQ